ncbi:acid-soluble spore protein H, partial [Geobacillus sp. A8]
LEMDVRRAQEIASSPVMANVTYNGQRIYIEHVDQQKGVATIHPLDNPNQKQSVPVASLEEHS